MKSYLLLTKLCIHSECCCQCNYQHIAAYGTISGLAPLPLNYSSFTYKNRCFGAVWCLCEPSDCRSDRSTCLHGMPHYNLNYKFPLERQLAFGQHWSAPGGSRTAKHFMLLIQSYPLLSVKHFLLVIQLCFPPKNPGSPCYPIIFLPHGALPDSYQITG